MFKSELTFKYNNKTYIGSNIKNGFSEMINDEVLIIATKHFNEKTIHLKEKIENENGIVHLKLIDSGVEYSFENFSDELVQLIEEALS